jgi:hypothetical protein
MSTTDRSKAAVHLGPELFNNVSRKAERPITDLA